MQFTLVMPFDYENTKKIIRTIGLVVALLAVAFLLGSYNTQPLFPNFDSQPQAAAVALPVLSPFVYSFNSAGVLQEAGTMDESSSPYFWLNSGGEMIFTGSAGQTMQGDATTTNKWRLLYGANNPTDTDGGLHPQNIFRLVTRSTWDNVSEQAQFYINKDNFSSSFNRNTSNGLLLMSRYKIGGQTLYYTGVRVDGTAVIKKKINGIYYTMAQQKIYPGTYTGWQDNQNLLPHNAWLGLRSDTVTNTDGSVTVTLYVMQPGSATWTKTLAATDSGQYGGTAPIVGADYMGIRTDFMDINFRSYRLQTI